MESSLPNTTSTPTPALAKMRPWDKGTEASLDIQRPFLAYSESDTSYMRHEAFIQATYHVGKRINDRITMIGNEFSYLHKVHAWIYLDELIEVMPITSKWVRLEDEKV